MLPRGSVGNGSSAFGYTLLELLVSLAIAAGLFAMLLPFAGAMLEMKNNTICVSNLRQIGMGILAYSQDNQGVLPGPLYSGQYPWYGPSSGTGVNGGDSTQLASYVQPYLDIEKTRTKKGGDDVFVCPSYKRAVRNKIGSSPVYRMNVEVRMRDLAGTHAPFGYPNRLHPVVFNTNKDFPPMRLTALAEIVDEAGRPARTSVWAMKDVDESDPIFAIYSHEYGAGVPKTMVHKTHRNALFFDFHVEAVDRDRGQFPSISSP